MKKPDAILTAQELEQCKREGIRIMRAAYYMHLENGGILELRRQITEPIKLNGDDPTSDSARRRYVFENASRPGMLTSLRRLDEYGNLAGLDIYKDSDGVWNANYAGCRFSDYEHSALTATDAKNLREVIAFIGDEFMARLERRYSNDPRDCFYCC